MAGKGESGVGSALASAYGSGNSGYGAGRFLGGQAPNLLGGSTTPLFASTPTPGGSTAPLFAPTPTPTVRPPGPTTLANQPFTTPSLSYGPIYWQQMAAAQAAAQQQAAADAAMANMPGRYQPGGVDYDVSGGGDSDGGW